MRRIIPLVLCMSLLLCGCLGTKQVPTGTAPAIRATTPPTTEEVTVPPTTEEVTVPPTTEETEPVILYRHPITGEPLQEQMTTRPVAVIINNINHAQPLHGIGAADLICEIMAEGGGGITRLLAVFTDLESAGKIGSVRSARTYLLDLARAFDAPIVHCGYSDYAQQEIWRTKYPSFNQFFYSDYFYRDQARLNAGYSKEHTLFTDGEKLLQGMTANGFDLVNEEGTDFGLTFTDAQVLEGQSANKIAFHFYRDAGKQTVLEYDAEADAYIGTQVWSNKSVKFADANTKENVPFRNVLLLYARTSTDGYRYFADLVGEGNGYYAYGGQIIPIKWYRESETEPFDYALEDGTPLSLSVGKTYMAVIPIGSPELEIQ